MTDEEMAEEYASSDKDKIDIIRTVKDWHLRKNGFLAGLKAGRPQWHKPSEKLPESDTIVLDEYGDRVFYDYDIKCWRYDDADLNISLPPIAWCEIPTFDKE